MSCGGRGLAQGSMMDEAISLKGTKVLVLVVGGLDKPSMTAKELAEGRGMMRVSLQGGSANNAARTSCEGGN